jgi:hypothetical protein
MPIIAALGSPTDTKRIPKAATSLGKRHKQIATPEMK